jgi:hypothetical protein
VISKRRWANPDRPGPPSHSLANRSNAILSALLIEEDVRRVPASPKLWIEILQVAVGFANKPIGRPIEVSNADLTGVVTNRNL